jgi:hypothetical protein
VQQWGGVATQSHAIHSDLGIGPDHPDGRGSRLGGLHYRVTCVDSLTAQYHAVVRCRSYGCLTGGDGVSVAADLEMEHRCEPEKKVERRNVSAGL